MPDENSTHRHEIILELKNLKRKTALMQACHGQMAEHLGTLESQSSIIVTLFAAFAIIATTAEARAILNFASEEDLRRVAALFSLIVFFATLLKLETRWGAKAASHTATLKAFTRFLRQLDITLKALDDKSDDELELLGTQLASEYSDICEISPDIPTRKFLKLKQKHVQNIGLSREIDKTPFLSLREMRKKIQQATQEAEE